MKILSILDHTEEFFMVILLALMSVIIFVQVIARYVFHNSIPWSEEIARYMFIWVVNFAISYGVKANAHVRVDAVITLLPKYMEKPFRIIGNLLFLVFAVLMVFYGFKVVAFILESNQTAPATGIPMGLVYMAVPVGFLLSSIRLVQNIIAKAKEVEVKS